MAKTPGSPVVVYLGPARCGKTHQLLHLYADALRGGTKVGPIVHNVWLAPSIRAVAHVHAQLLALGLDACLQPGVMTFRDLTGLLLAPQTPPRRRLLPVVERELLRRVVQHALQNKQLAYFADAARRSAFIQLLADHVHELQRADIRPDAYAQFRPPHANDDAHRELAQLYSEFDRLLAAHSLTNEDGSHRLACDLLAAGKTNSLQKLNLVVVDGFTDFTRTQHDILRLLAQRANQLLISLPGEPADARGPRTDLFAKTASTLHDLKHYHPRLAVREFAARPSAWPALDHLLQHVFRNPAEPHAPTPAALDSLSRLQIIAGASAHDEIVQLARRIKQQLTGWHALRLGEGRGGANALQPRPSRTQGEPPSDIIVVFRSLSEVAPRIREVFDQFGIPYALEVNMPLAASPLVKTLLSLLRLDQEDWPFRRLVSIITNNLLTEFDLPMRQSAEWLVRDLQIAAGREKLLSRVHQLAAVQSPREELGERTAHRVQAAQAALPLFERLAESLHVLPQSATPADWFAALVHLASSFAVPDSGDAPGWPALEAHFASLHRLDAWLGDAPQKLSRGDLVRTLLDIVTRESLPTAPSDPGRVRIVAAPAVRSITARHLYLAGMSEQSFPTPEPAGHLAAAADYQFLANAAHQEPAARPAPRPPAPTRSQEEMLLFYEVLSRADESLTISYPALDDKAQRLPPSPYVLEIQRLFGDPQRNPLEPLSPRLSPVPPDDEKPFSATDYRIRAVAHAIRSEPDLQPLSGLLSSHPSGPAIDAGLRIVHSRARGDSFGPAEGRLASPDVAARLAQRFGPRHDWSTSQLEKYAACPYRFFLENVLHLDPLGDLVLQTDAARRGSRLHGVLAAFHRQWTALRDASQMSEDDQRSQFLEYLGQTIDEQTAAGPEGGIDAALLELDRRQIRKWADKHFDHHQKYSGAYAQGGVAMRPAHFEFRFGPPRPGADPSDPNSLDNALVLQIRGEPLRFTGQIDRIDVGTVEGQTVFNVIDYKSGSKFTFSDEKIASGERLQLPIYVEAAQVMLFGGQGAPLVAGYWWMSAGFDTRGALSKPAEPERWQNLRHEVHELVGQFVHDIRRGKFPVYSSDEQCVSYCQFSTLCRVSQARNLNKHPDTAPNDGS